MKPNPFDPQDIEFLISRLIDNDLEGDARRLLDEKLADNNELQGLQRDFARLDQALKSVPGVPESDWKRFETQVLAGCRRVQVESARRRLYRWAGGMLAAAAAVAMVSTVLIQSWGPTATSTTVAVVSVGPKVIEQEPSQVKSAVVQFSFARGGSLPEPATDELVTPPSRTLIVASASPMIGNGMSLGEFAF